MISQAVREAALTRFAELASGRERPNRYWKIDLEAFALGDIDVAPAVFSPTITSKPARGLIACDLAKARIDHADLLERAFGAAVARHPAKFGALATAFANAGAFIYVPPGVVVDEPITIAYRTNERSAFPYTLVFAGSGAQCTVVERIETGEGGFVCGVSEVVTEAGAHVTYASVQTHDPQTRSFMTRAALPGADATVTLADAELGGSLALCDIDVTIAQRGVHATIAALFFPAGDEHVDVTSTVSHDIGQSRSETVVKSAGTGSGQVRYLGNIRIAANAQGSQAFLRDDALLLSRAAHVDSVPALEIAANDVKAFHGATVGAIDEEQLFYMTSRGLDRSQAEKMIALGFFEPVIAHFPTEALREEIRHALEAKVR